MIEGEQIILRRIIVDFHYAGNTEIASCFFRQELGTLQICDKKYASKNKKGTDSDNPDTRSRFGRSILYSCKAAGEKKRNDLVNTCSRAPCRTVPQEQDTIAIRWHLYSQY